MSAAAEPFSVRTERRTDTVYVIVSGELDTDASEQLRRALAGIGRRDWVHVDGGMRRTMLGVVIDLERVTVLDSTAIRTLVDTAAAAGANGWHLEVRAKTNERIGTILRETGIDLLA